MPASSPPHTPEQVALRINLLALNLAIELARAGAAGRGLAAPAQAMRELCELLDDDSDQLGAGEGLRRAVEELERVLRQAGEMVQRSPGAHGDARIEAAGTR
jgi:methyl-accepting chemotaxis protein